MSPRKGIGIYFVLALLLVALLIVPSILSKTTPKYTRGEFEAAVDAGKVASAVIEPNKISKVFRTTSAASI